ncbi:hypothetical protein [Burkholderia gladioli]|uniref:hypothetical protein n=1 Tax=Burkholderia gladioli TaxID=28095 RepID=UPI001640FF5C|nr:hypothetical protein [Burkholderia gladioli]
MTVLQREFINWCIAYSRFEIARDMSISMITWTVASYDELVADVSLDRYGFCTPRMVELGKSLFPDAPGSPEGSGFDEAYDLVCTALDEWLAGPVMPLQQVSFPPEDGEPFDEDESVNPSRER